MKRCLQLAKNGIGNTRPNPSVGAVIVHNNKIIGEGYTSSYGGNHAEVNAINSVRNKDLLKESTIYVTLEPCSHFGKTPPCANLIVQKKIPNIVIGCIDTNSLVAGKGIAILKEAGCNVTIGVLEKECLNHHKRFFTIQNKKRPYIILKWAETENNLIAPKTKKEKRPVWISNKFSRQLAHKLRSQEHGILVGSNTVLEDNPSLNIRSWTGHNPTKIIIDRTLKIQDHFSIFKGTTPIIILTEKEIKSSNKHIHYERIDFSKNIPKQICRVLYQHNIQSVIIEGGRKTLQSFIDNNIWDEAIIFKSSIQFEEGIKSPCLTGKFIEEHTVGDNRMTIYHNL